MLQAVGLKFIMRFNSKCCVLIVLFSVTTAVTGNQLIQRSCARRDVLNTRKEIFAFFNGCKKETWSKFPLSKLTTIAVGDCFDPEFICTAHQHGARVVLFDTYPVKDLLDKQKRLKWIMSKLKLVQTNDMDGLNIDFEDPLRKNSAEVVALTQLATETTRIFHEAVPSLQVSFDFAWAPDCVDGRCYDYLAISKVVDLVFIMSYDEQSQIFVKQCTAKANSGLARTRRGVNAFLALGLAREKIVLGMPWYGYDYTCISIALNNTCVIKEVPFRGVNCSDAAGRQIQYAVIEASLLPQSTTGRLWDGQEQSPYFNYKKSDGVVHQVWYDDPVSLKAKYDALVTALGLRGAGMWSAEQLDYSDTEQGRRQRGAMWGALSQSQRPRHQTVVGVGV